MLLLEALKMIAESMETLNANNDVNDFTVKIGKGEVSLSARSGEVILNGSYSYTTPKVAPPAGTPVKVLRESGEWALRYSTGQIVTEYGIELLRVTTEDPERPTATYSKWVELVEKG